MSASGSRASLAPLGYRLTRSYEEEGIVDSLERRLGVKVSVGEESASAASVYRFRNALVELADKPRGFFLNEFHAAFPSHRARDGSFVELRDGHVVTLCISGGSIDKVPSVVSELK